LIHLEGGGRQFKLTARAKVNIGLHILGERPDGYHEIWTIFQQVNLADEILLKESSDLSFSVETDLLGIPDDDTNLCMKAAHLLRQETGCDKGAAITLKKIIPPGSGLGGGSSDAAATLTGLNRLWETGLKRTSLLELASKLGSDVPFFIAGGCCIGTGRGEVLHPIDPVIIDPIVLICPEVKISTKWAYKNIKNYHLTSRSQIVIFQDSLRKSFQQLHSHTAFTNDFEPLVFAYHPSLKALKEALIKHGAYYVSLSGSGSSIFGVFSSTRIAKEAVTKMEAVGATLYLG